MDVTLVVWRLRGMCKRVIVEGGGHSWRAEGWEGCASVLLSRGEGIPGELRVSTFNSNSSLSFWSFSGWSCWSKERADDAVSSIAMGNEEAASTIADLSLDDWVDCLVDRLYGAGLLCSSRLRSPWRYALEGKSHWKSGSNTFLDLRLGCAPGESDITTKKSMEKKDGNEMRLQTTRWL